MSSLNLNKSWWEQHPMTYDWQEKIDDSHVTVDYFDIVDRRMREGHWFAQTSDEPLFARLIPYGSLKGKQILEIGCGLGSIAQEFARQGGIVTGVDITERAIRLTSRRFDLRALTGSFVQASAEKLPFENEQFDFVWSWGVIHHTPGTKQAINEIWRVLKPGGKIGIMVYNRFSMRNLFRVVFLHGILQMKLAKLSLEELENEYSDGAIAKHYSPSRFKALFEKKFQDVELSIFGQRSEIFPGYHRIPTVFTFPVEPLIRSLLRKFGWFLFVSASRS